MAVINKSGKLLLVAHISDRCNFNCAYCYSYKSRKSMSEKTMVALSKFAGSLINSGFCRSIVLAVEGGEPTLNMPLLKKLVKLSQEKQVKEFIICTNGSSLDKKLIDYLLVNKIYPVISFESKKSFIKNRVPDNLKIAKKMWNKINNSLRFFARRADRYSKDKSDDFDKIRGRVTITPSTVENIFESVEHLYKSPLGEKILITLMPAMSESLDREWRAFAKDKERVAVLEKEFGKIAELYISGIRNKKKLNFCINECISLDFTDLGLNCGLSEIPFCGAGDNLIGTDMEGNIFPCYLLAARQAVFREKFKFGNVFRGFDSKREKIINNFCGEKQNKCFSCLYWNRIANKSPNKPAAAYVLFYNAWAKAALHVQSKLGKKQSQRVMHKKKHKK